MARKDMADFGYDNMGMDADMGEDAYEAECMDAHQAFLEGTQETEGVIITHDPSAAPRMLPPDAAPVESDDITYNPSVSEKQRRYMGAALGRARAGKSLASDPHMSMEKLRDFARKR